MATSTHLRLIINAASLLSEHGENPEYDRGVIELLESVTGGNPDDWHATELLLRFIKEDPDA